MFKQAFRFAFIALIWKQYKSLIISTLMLFAYVFLISNVHSDYLSHLQLQQKSDSSGLSFLYKWLAYATGISAYFMFHWWRSKPKKSNNKEKIMAELESLNTDDDPFANIRKRRNLRSRADFIDGKD